MSELEKAVEQLRLEGISTEKIKEAIKEAREEAMNQPIITGSLDDYLDSLEDDEEEDASFFEKRLKESLKDPEFKQAWEESEEEYLNQRFAIYVLEELITEFGMSEKQASECIENSIFTEMLDESPNFVFHYDSSYWANVIYNEKLGDETLLERIKRLEDNPDSAVKWRDIRREE